MSSKRKPLALYDISDAVEKLRELLGERSVQEIADDFILRAASERFVEIISEATRRIDPEWTRAHPEVPWAKVAGIGNILRHDYEKVKIEVIVRLREADLDILQNAVEALLREHDPEGLALRERLKGAGELQ